jgi:hypothetical protein
MPCQAAVRSCARQQIGNRTERICISSSLKKALFAASQSRMLLSCSPWEPGFRGSVESTASPLLTKALFRLTAHSTSRSHSWHRELPDGIRDGVGSCSWEARRASPALLQRFEHPRVVVPEAVMSVVRIPVAFFHQNLVQQHS